MKKSKSDHSIFYQRSTRATILLVVYVDDIVIIVSDTSDILSLKSFLQSQFHTKELGVLTYILGTEAMRDKKGIFMSSRKYVLDLSRETGKLGAKPCDTLMMPSLQPYKDGEPFKDHVRYRRLVGKLIYLTVTRPDIAYSVSMGSQFMTSLTMEHWDAIQQILCYLKVAPGCVILYEDHGHMNIEG